MYITMIKKQLLSGEACRKCLRTQDLLERRGLFERVDEVVWAIEGQPESPGWQLARLHGVATAPFFVVRDDQGAETVYTSVLVMIRERLSDAPPGAEAVATGSSAQSQDEEMAAHAVRLEQSGPQAAVDWALSRFGSECAIAFSGAEDVVLIDMAFKSGSPFSVITLDTGRLAPETYEYLEAVREHYSIDIEVYMPDAGQVAALVREKGLFSFYRDGHSECCQLRKVAPLARALGGYRAWMSGQRRDQNQSTRGTLPVLQTDPRFVGAEGPLIKLNPLATWSSAQTWRYIHEHGVPHNPLHQRGYVSIGCAPCTRPILPGQHERVGRWWWEQGVSKECGLHVSGSPDAPPQSAKS